MKSLMISLLLVGATFTGTAFANQAACTWKPLYRYHNPETGDHVYTSNWHDLQYGNADGWRLEGMIGMVSGNRCDHATVPLYRYEKTDSGDHRLSTYLTTDYGWKRNPGVVGYVADRDVHKKIPHFYVKLYEYRAGDDFMYTVNYEELREGDGHYQRTGWPMGYLFKPF